MICTLLDALGVRFVAFALWQWADWGTDILFLDAEIYGDEFRKHPSFEATRTAAIFFDVLGFIALVWALRRKAMFQLRIRKAAREGKFEDDDQRKRFEKMYLGGQTFLYTAFVLLLLECFYSSHQCFVLLLEQPHQCFAVVVVTHFVLFVASFLF